MGNEKNKSTGMASHYFHFDFPFKLLQFGFRPSHFEKTRKKTKFQNTKNLQINITYGPSISAKILKYFF